MASYLALAHLFDDDGVDDTPVHKRKKYAPDLETAEKLIDKGYEYISFEGTTKLGNTGGVQLAILINQRPRTLKKIALDNQKIGTKAGVALFRVLKYNKTIITVELAGNNFGVQALKAFGQMLLSNNTLSYVDLGYNRGIGDKSAFEIARGLEGNDSLKSLGLSKTSIAEKGIIALAVALEKNRGLTYLNLNRNPVSVKAAEAIAKALSTNDVLSTLHIRSTSTKMGDKGAEYIAAALETNVGLVSLGLQKCNFHDAGAVKLGLALSKNNTLKTLDLTGNTGIKERGLLSLANGVEVNSTITKVFVDAWTSNAKLTLDEHLARNKELNEEKELDFFSEIANNSSTKGPLMRSKLMVIGEGMAGKSATVRSLLGEPFDPTWNSTIGAELRETKVNAKAGWQELTDQTQRNLTTDFAARAALQKLQEAKKQEHKRIQEGEDRAIVGKNLKGDKEEVIAVGDLQLDQYVNEEDLIAQRVENGDLSAPLTYSFGDEEDDEDGDLSAPLMAVEEVAQRFEKDLLTKAKSEVDTIKFSIWDYGGQTIFYSLHHLFLTKYGIYLLVFDMRELIKSEEQSKKSLEYIRFWMSSVFMHAPTTPLLLVGTYLDEIAPFEENQTAKVTENLFKEKTVIIESKLKVLLESFAFKVIQNEVDSLSFFPISNKAGRGIFNVRETIDRVAREQEYMKMKIPIGWLHCLESLLRNRKKRWMSILDIRTEARKHQITSLMEVEKMLDLFHELGMLVHLTQTTALQEVVTTNPQWLIDAIGKVIRDQRLHKHNMKKIKKAGLEEELEKMFSTGIATIQLLRHLWDDKQVPFLIDLMRQSTLMCDWRFEGAEKESKYFIPSLVHYSAADEDEVSQEVETDENDAMCFFSFPFLPIGVFDRLVCLCVGYSSRLQDDHTTNAPVMHSKDTCSIWFTPEAPIRLQLIEDKGEICLVSSRNAPVEASKHALSVVSSMLLKLKEDVMGGGLKWQIKYSTSDGDIILQEQAVENKLSPWFAEDSSSVVMEQVEANVDINAFLESLQEL